MSQRERLLAAIVGASAVFMIVMYVANSMYSAYQRRVSEKRGLMTRIDDSEFEAQRGLRIADELQEVADHSLSGNTSLARSAYQDWLMNLADQHIGLSNVSVKMSGPNPVRLPAGMASGDSNIAFQVHKFELTGAGDIEQFTDLLFDMQTAEINHRVVNVKLLPVPSSKQLQISLTMEVMAMETAPERSKLELTHAEQLAGRSRETLKDSILGRNIFGPENNPPELRVDSRYVAYINQPFSLRLEGSDPDPLDQVFFEAELDDLDRARFSAREGRIDWTPRERGEYRIRVAAVDDSFPQGRTERQVTIRVEDPPARQVRAEAPPRPSLSAARFVFVTGVTESSGEKQVWLDYRTEGKTLQLGVGDSFQLGSVEAAVAAISDQQVEIEAGGKRVSVGLGKSLAESGL